MSDRTVLYTRLHWISLISRYAVLALVPALILLSNPELRVYAAALLCAAVFITLARTVRWLNSSLVITTERVVSTTGALSRNTIELFLDRIEGIAIHQSLLGRIFGFGDLLVSGTGSFKERFQCIPRPRQVRDTIQKQVATMRKSR
jgi:uncharacterized membrane protein YdbT with pleckstrin-like domain